MSNYSFNDFITDLIMGLGFILIFCPILIYWFIHGNYYRYIWIVSGPYPFNAITGGTFQYIFYGAFILAGIALITIGIISKRSRKSSKYWY